MHGQGHGHSSSKRTSNERVGGGAPGRVNGRHAGGRRHHGNGAGGGKKNGRDNNYVQFYGEEESVCGTEFDVASVRSADTANVTDTAGGLWPQMVEYDEG